MIVKHIDLIANSANRIYCSKIGIIYSFKKILKMDRIFLNSRATLIIKNSKIVLLSNSYSYTHIKLAIINSVFNHEF